jgi:hypothetical protein
MHVTGQSSGLEGPRKPEQLNANLIGTERKLTPEEVTQVEQIGV